MGAKGGRDHFRLKITPNAQTLHASVGSRCSSDRVEAFGVAFTRDLTPKAGPPSHGLGDHQGYGQLAPSAVARRFA
jgi:hypothetical protein